jgi:hypothetical protein
MRRLTAERVFDRDETGARSIAPRHPQLAVDVGEQRDIDVLEKAFAHEIRLRPDELLGGAGPDPDRARQLLALHDLLHREDGGEVDRLAGVVALAMPGSPFDHRRVVGDAGLL